MSTPKPSASTSSLMHITVRAKSRWTLLMTASIEAVVCEIVPSTSRALRSSPWHPEERLCVMIDALRLKPADHSNSMFKPVAAHHRLHRRQVPLVRQGVAGETHTLCAVLCVIIRLPPEVLLVAQLGVGREAAIDPFEVSHGLVVCLGGSTASAAGPVRCGCRVESRSRRHPSLERAAEGCGRGYAGEGRSTHTHALTEVHEKMTELAAHLQPAAAPLAAPAAVLVLPVMLLALRHCSSRGGNACRGTVRDAEVVRLKKVLPESEQQQRAASDKPAADTTVGDVQSKATALGTPDAGSPPPAPAVAADTLTNAHISAQGLAAKGLAVRQTPASAAAEALVAKSLSAPAAYKGAPVDERPMSFMGMTVRRDRTLWA